VALVNDFDVVVAGLASILQPFAQDIEVVDLAADRLPREGVLVDVALYDTYGRASWEPERVRDLMAQPNVRYVAIYSFDDAPERVAEALAVGVHGYLWKGATATQLVSDLKRVGNGEVVVHGAGHRRGVGEGDWPGRDRGLTRRESEVLALLMQGLTNREIAQALYVSDETIKTHLSGLFRKLGVNNRTKAASVALSDPMFARSQRPAVSQTRAAS
jgi:NarL family two-component system response regulator LiaR